MKKNIFILFLLIHITSFSFSQKTSFQQKVNYNISVGMDPIQKSLQGNSKITYFNNSPNDLNEIYIYLYINNYNSKNSELTTELLKEGNVNLYFSNNEEQGAYTHIDFLNRNTQLKWSYLDKNKTIVKIELNSPIKSGKSLTINIPFTIKIPKYINDIGYTKNQFIFYNWYPQVIFYDENGWNIKNNATESLLQSHFGNFNVKIKIPENYIIVASGNLITKSEELFIKNRISDSKNNNSELLITKYPLQYKTIEFEAENINSFSWITSNNFSILKDTITLSDKNNIDLYIYYFQNKTPKPITTDLLSNVKDAILSFTKTLGKYPYQKIAIVFTNDIIQSRTAPMLFNLKVSKYKNEFSALSKEQLKCKLGHLWTKSYFSINNEKSPWVLIGLSSNIDWITKKNHIIKFLNQNTIKKPSNLNQSMYIDTKETKAALFKTIISFNYLKNYLGKKLYNKTLNSLYEKYKFKSIKPSDIISHFENETSKELAWFFDGMIGTGQPMTYKIDSIVKLDHGYKVIVENIGKYKIPFDIGGKTKTKDIYSKPIEGFIGKKEIVLNNQNLKTIEIDPNNLYYKNKELNTKENIKFSFNLPKFSFLGLNNDYLIAPFIGYNANDGLMAGLFLNNDYPSDYHFNFAPLYGFKSKGIVGAFNFSKSLLPNDKFKKIKLGIEGKSFHRLVNKERDFNLRYSRISLYSIAEWGKSNFNPNNSFKYKFSVIKDENYTRDGIKSFYRYMNNFDFEKKGGNIITPYSIKLSLEHQYYFNYSDRHYVSVASQISTSYMYKKHKSIHLRLYGSTYLFNTNTYSTGSMPGTLNLIGNGLNDDSYEEIFFNRTEQNDFWARQLTMNTGGFKNAYTSPYGIGQSNKYVASINLKFDLPMSSFIKPYFDFGVYGYLPTLSDGYSNKSIYSSGFIFEIIKDRFEIYLPLINSDEIESIYKEKDSFWSRFSFLLDLNIQ